MRSPATYNENINDLKNHIKLQARLNGQASSHIPAVYSVIPTDLGPGLMVQLIRDIDGAISLTLKEYISKNGFDAPAQRAVSDLKAFLIEQLIPFRDPFPHNIALQSDRNLKLTAYVIDGIGNSSLLSFAQRIRPIARRHIAKKCRRLDKAIERTLANRDNQVQFSSKGMLLKRS